LKYAKRIQKKKFVVYTLEVEPLLQGRKTAEELAEAGIKTIIFPDLAAEQALKKCDIFFFGADAFLKDAVVNKIGTSMLCKLANELKIPNYSCGVSLKYAHKIKIETRSGREVWDEKNDKITVVNPAFDVTKYKFLSGIISEFGVLNSKQFVKHASKTIDQF
jgi:translation initiation factor 2B subunit (eIF-2B alpha/beta/delta family)